MFGLFNRGSKKEYIRVDTDKLKNYLVEQGITEEKKINEIIEEFKQSIENKVQEKTELTYEEFLAGIEEITGKIYQNATNRIDLCKQIDEFIENNPEVSNSIQLYASYITYGAINIKLDDYTVNLIGDNEEEVERARNIISKFEKFSKIKRIIYLIAKDLVTYGDAFLEKIYDKATGRLKSVAYLPSNKIIILVDPYGEIKKIYQVLDDSLKLADIENERYMRDLITDKKIIEFDKHEIAHFNDGTIPGFNDSPLRNLIAVWKSFKLIEEALIVHRITRARRLLIFFLDVTGKEPTAVRKLVSSFVQKLTAAFKIDISNATTISRKSMVKQGSDIVIPITKDSATKVQSIPADTSATKIDDLKFYHNRILKNLLTSHIFGEDNLSKDKADQLDKALIRRIRTYQRYISYTLEDLYQELLRTYDIRNVEVNIQFPTADNDEEIKIVDTLIRRIMVINQLVATVGIVPPFEWIVNYVFKDLTQPEIRELISLLKQEKKKQEDETQGQEYLSFLNEDKAQEQNKEIFSTFDLIAKQSLLSEDDIKEQTSKQINKVENINKIIDLTLKYLEMRNRKDDRW